MILCFNDIMDWCLRSEEWTEIHFITCENDYLQTPCSLFYFIIHQSAFGLGFGGNQSSNTTIFKLSGHCLITHNLLQFHFSQLTHSLMLMLPTATAPLISWLRQPKTITLLSGIHMLQLSPFSCAHAHSFFQE